MDKAKKTRTPAANRAQYRYNEKNLKRVPLDLQKTFYEEVKEAAEASGESVNGYIKQAIRDRMNQQKYNHTPETSAEGTQDAAEGKKEAQPMKL